MDRRARSVRQKIPYIVSISIIVFHMLQRNRSENVTKTIDDARPLKTSGLVLHAPVFYDLTVRLMTLGRERAFRERLLGLAHLKPGESVLDVGCGTGSLAIAARRHVGSAGDVTGIDASPEMLARAERKARKAGVTILFKRAAAQALPFPDAQFDAVFATVMFHHLPRKGREECAGEMRRVMKPGGRLLVVDFTAPAQRRSNLLDHFHRRHGHVNLDDIVATLEATGLAIVDRGAVQFRNLQFALATDLRHP
jgi:ubiquinone/menaquinone biosynthesis C-methylase UbiE